MVQLEMQYPAIECIKKFHLHYLANYHMLNA